MLTVLQCGWQGPAYQAGKPHLHLAGTSYWLWTYQVCRQHCVRGWVYRGRDRGGHVQHLPSLHQGVWQGDVLLQGLLYVSHLWPRGVLLHGGDVPLRGQEGSGYQLGRCCGEWNGTIYSDSSLHTTIYINNAYHHTAGKRFGQCFHFLEINKLKKYYLK